MRIFCKPSHMISLFWISRTTWEHQLRTQRLYGCYSQHWYWSKILGQCTTIFQLQAVARICSTVLGIIHHSNTQYFCHHNGEHNTQSCIKRAPYQQECDRGVIFTAPRDCPVGLEDKPIEKGGYDQVLFSEDGPTLKLGHCKAFESWLHRFRMRLGKVEIREWNTISKGNYREPLWKYI